MTSNQLLPGAAFAYDNHGWIYVMLGESEEGVTFLISRRSSLPRPGVVEIKTISRKSIEKGVAVEFYLPPPASWNKS